MKPTMTALAILLSPVCSGSERRVLPPILAEQLLQLAGPGAADCNESTDPYSLRETIRCAQRAIAANQPFRFAIPAAGTDTEYWVGIAGSSTGETWKLIYDSNPSGSPSDTPRFERTRCVDPTFDATRYPFMLCAAASAGQRDS